MIEIDREITQDFTRATGLEWLETNGLGGWAGTTIAGAHSRRDHGLLVAAAEAPSTRTVLLSRLDETLHLEGESFELGCNQFPGAVAPRGYEHLARFRQDLFPVFDFQAGGVRLRKTVAAVDGETTTLVLYEVLEAPAPFILSLRPFLAARDRHALSAANSGVSEETPHADGILRLRLYPDVPEIFLQVPAAEFRAHPQWWYRFEYEGDRRRGVEFQEDLWTPGVFGRELAAGDRLGIVISTRDPQGRDAFALFEKERKRREKLVKAIDQKLGAQDDLARYLALAADGFVVRRGTSRRAVLAGYPASDLEEGERSRETMIALPGLCLVTGRHEDAKKILRAFARVLHQGLLPDRLPEHDEAPTYTSVDAPLWLFVAVFKYLQASGDEAFVRETLLPALRKVVHSYGKGTLLGIKADAGGLLAADADATWLPGRAGKAVEVNALWFNALSILADLEARLGDPDEAKLLAQRARKVQKAFQEAFWQEEGGYLVDVVGPDSRDAALRPSQIFALSLPFPLLPKPKAARALAAIAATLYTPTGLREGADRGTAWAWLLGAYLTALVRVHGAAGRKQGLAAIAALKPRLAEAGVGPLSEIFDAEAPHSPRGRVSGAWSVAEVLRAYVEDLRCEEPSPAKPRQQKAVKEAKETKAASVAAKPAVRRSPRRKE
jgi:predicted glycogen debranching enzyme